MCGIENTTSILNKLTELSSTNILGPFEQEVFKEVSETPAIRTFILTSYMVHYTDRNNGRTVVLMQDHMQAVVQVEFSVGYGTLLCSNRGCYHICSGYDGNGPPFSGPYPSIM